MTRVTTTRRPRMVVLRALGLGDFLTGIPAYRALARAYPSHYRILAAPIELAPLVEQCGAIDELVDTRGLASLDPSLHGADIAVNLHGCGPQSHRLLLETEPAQLIAFRHTDVGIPQTGPDFRTHEHEVERWCRMLSESGIPADSRDLDLDARPYVGQYYRSIVLHPGASSEARRWPIANWIALAKHLQREGYSIVLTGAADEFRRCRIIARNAEVPFDRILAGKTRLDELASLVASALAVICGDTGIAHLATALRTPSVILFGPVSPAEWGPPVERAQHRVIWRGATGNTHASVVHSGLAAIRVDEVVAELSALFEGRRAG